MVCGATVASSFASMLTEVAPLSRHDLECAIEALLFVTREPLGLADLTLLTKCDERAIAAALRTVKLRYQHRGIRVTCKGARYSFAAAPSTRAAIVRYFDEPRMLSDSASDVLALVAYLQPITAAQIMEYHDADPAHVLQTLQEAGLIQCSPGEGSALFFRTTAAFLEAASLQSLDELPPAYESVTV